MSNNQHFPIFYAKNLIFKTKQIYPNLQILQKHGIGIKLQSNQYNASRNFDESDFIGKVILKTYNHIYLKYYGSSLNQKLAQKNNMKLNQRIQILKKITSGWERQNFFNFYFNDNNIVFFRNYFSQKQTIKMYYIQDVSWSDCIESFIQLVKKILGDDLNKQRGQSLMKRIKQRSEIRKELEGLYQWLSGKIRSEDLQNYIQEMQRKNEQNRRITMVEQSKIYNNNIGQIGGKNIDLKILKKIAYLLIYVYEKYKKAKLKQEKQLQLINLINEFLQYIIQNFQNSIPNQQKNLIYASIANSSRLLKSKTNLFPIDINYILALYLPQSQFQQIRNYLHRFHQSTLN